MLSIISIVSIPFYQFYILQGNLTMNFNSLRDYHMAQMAYIFLLCDQMWEAGPWGCSSRDPGNGWGVVNGAEKWFQGKLLELEDGERWWERVKGRGEVWGEGGIETGSWREEEGAQE